MSIFALFVAEAASLVVGRLLRPKSPQRPGDKFTVPDIVEGTPVPYVFGTAKVDRPFLSWWGNADSVLGQPFNGSAPTEYYAAMVFNVCQGPVDQLVDIAIGGKSLSIWPATAAAQGQPQPQVLVPGTPAPVTPSLPHGFGVDNMVVFNVDAQDLLGGLGKDGGVVGQVRFYPGIPTGIIYEPLLLQAGVNAGLLPNPPDGSHASGQPFVCYAAFDGYPGAAWPNGLYPGPPRFNSFWWGNNSATPRTVSFVVGRWPGQLQNAFRVIGQDANAVNVIWELLTDPIQGAGLPESLFDKAGFQAAAQQVYQDGLGVSGTIDTPAKLYDLIVDLLRHIDGTIFPDPITGLYSIRLARPDYDPLTLDVLDESRVGGLVVSRFDWSETINQLNVTYRRLASGPVGGTAISAEILTFHYHATFLGQFGYYNTQGQNPTNIVVHNVSQGTSAVPAPGTSVALVNPPNGTLRITIDFANEGDQLTVDYTSGSTEVGFVEASNPIQNLANRQTTGEVRPETADFRFFTNDVSAFNRGRILLQALSSPLDKVEWSEDRRGNVRRPGDVVILNVPEKGLNSTVVRITDIDYGLLQQGKIKCQGLEDVWGALLVADFGAPGGTAAAPTNPVARQAPAMAISCVSPGTPRVGLFPSDTSFNIELQQADNSIGTGQADVSPAGGFPGTTAFYDAGLPTGTTKYYRGRLIRPGFLPGAWTPWMGCTSTAGTPGTPSCTVPTVAQATNDTTGTLTLTLTDPQARVSLVEFRTRSGTAAWSPWTATPFPYTATVVLSSADSRIEWRVTYLDCGGNAGAQATGAHDYLVNPGAVGLQLVDVDLAFIDDPDGIMLDGVPSAEGAVRVQDARQFDASPYDQARLVADVDVAAAAGSQVAFRYSTDGGSTWAALDGASGPAQTIAATGPRVSPWIALVAGAIADVLFGWIPYGGDGATQPVLTQLALQFRKGVSALRCRLVPGSTEDFETYADTTALLAAWPETDSAAFQTPTLSTDYALSGSHSVKLDAATGGPYGADAYLSKPFGGFTPGSAVRVTCGVLTNRSPASNTQNLTGIVANGVSAHLTTSSPATTWNTVTANCTADGSGNITVRIGYSNMVAAVGAPDFLAYFDLLQFYQDCP